jgi:hypothetical protein
MYWSRSLTAVARELARYKLDLVGVLEVRWEKGGTLSQGIAHLSLEDETKITNWEHDFCTTQNNVNSYKSRVC